MAKETKQTGIIIDANKLDNALELLDDLAKMMDDMIVELHKVQGGQQARHAYIFYREKVWNAMSELNQGIKID
jgi:tetrahydromethanopterin S-methyltransferase subunit G